MSDLTSAGSTRRWRERRSAHAQLLAYLGSVECWRAEHNRTHTTDTVDQSDRCTKTIRNGQPWHLGHKTDRALGGNDTELGFECVPCSNYTGGRTAGLLARARAAVERWA